MTPMPTIHGCAVLIGETGVLIRGPSGAGKSTLVLALIEAANARGLFARLVADDRVRLVAASGRLIALPHPAIAGLIEERGLGILERPHEDSARIGLIVDLAASPDRLPEPQEARLSLEGIELPRLSLPADLPLASATRRILGFF